MKSCLVLNGSPHENGYTMRLVNHALRDIDRHIHSSYRMVVAPCDDCKLCEKTFACRHRDGMDAFLKALRHARSLLIATPVYFGAPSDTLMRIINRLQPLYHRKITGEAASCDVQKLMFVSTCASTDKSMFDGTKSVFKLLCKLFEPEHAFTLLCEGSDVYDNFFERHTPALSAFTQCVHAQYT